MQKGAIILVVFGVTVILFPVIIAYLIGAFVLFIGINMFLLSRNINKKKEGKKDYVKFGEYKIYRNSK